MRNRKWLWSVVVKIYTQMFKEAEPSLDFMELCNDMEEKKQQLEQGWFFNHYLSMERQAEIIEEFRKKYQLNTREMKIINFNIHLGCSPNSSKESWKKRRSK